MTKSPEQDQNRIGSVTASAVLGLLVGAGLMFLYMRSNISGRHGSRKRSGLDDGVSAADRTIREGRRRTKGRAGSIHPGSGSLGPGSLTALYQQAQHRVSQLTAENKRLQRLLEFYREDQKATQGKPTRWPSNTASRFLKERLLDALSEAMKEAGINGNITDVDCREYPCVVGGEIKGNAGPELFRKLRETSALSEYKGDPGMTTMSRSRRKGADGTLEQKSYFGISVLPKGDGGGSSDLRRRTGFRLQQLMEAMSPE